MLDYNAMLYGLRDDTHHPILRSLVLQLLPNRLQLNIDRPSVAGTGIDGGKQFATLMGSLLFTDELPYVDNASTRKRATFKFHTRLPISNARRFLLESYERTIAYRYYPILKDKPDEYDAICKDYGMYLHFYNLQGTGAITETFNELGKEEVQKEVFKGLYLVPRTTYTTDVYHKIYVFANKAGTETLVFTNKVDHEIIAKTLSQAYLRKLMAMGVNLPNDITTAFIQGDLVTILDWYEPQIAEYFDKQKLTNLEKFFNEEAVQFLQARINQTQSNLDNITRHITELWNEIGAYNADHKRLLLEYSALKNNPQTSATVGTELINYIKETNREEMLYDVTLQSNKMLLFGVRCPMIYWDDAIADEYFKNKDSVLYECIDDITATHVRLLKEIFITRKAVVYTYSYMKLDIVEAIIHSYNRTVQQHTKDSFQHPHIMQFDCWGDNKYELQQALKSNQTIAFWEQLLSTLQALNLTDYTVVEHYLDDIFNINCTSVKGIEYEGTMYSTQELLNKFKEEASHEEN